METVVGSKSVAAEAVNALAVVLDDAEAQVARAGQ